MPGRRPFRFVCYRSPVSSGILVAPPISRDSVSGVTHPRGWAPSQAPLIMGGRSSPERSAGVNAVTHRCSDVRVNKVNGADWPVEIGDSDTVSFLATFRNAGPQEIPGLSPRWEGVGKGGAGTRGGDEGRVLRDGESCGEQPDRLCRLFPPLFFKYLQIRSVKQMQPNSRP